MAVAGRRTWLNEVIEWSRVRPQAMGGSSLDMFSGNQNAFLSHIRCSYPLAHLLPIPQRNDKGADPSVVSFNHETCENDSNAGDTCYRHGWRHEPRKVSILFFRLSLRCCLLCSSRGGTVENKTAV